jgi:hypothetical protein
MLAEQLWADVAPEFWVGVSASLPLIVVVGFVFLIHVSKGDLNGR